MKKRIEEGDIVNISFCDGSEMSNCEVLYIPQAAGDSWHLRNDSGDLVYVQLFEIMKLVIPRT